jgi:hypothetical protein
MFGCIISGNKAIEFVVDDVGGIPFDIGGFDDFGGEDTKLSFALTVAGYWC